MSDQNDSSGLFGGSIDRSKLEDMKAAAGDDPDLQAQIPEVQAQVDSVAETEAAAEKYREEVLLGQPSAEEEPAEEPEYEPEAPPRAGAGSGRDAWAAYAESQEVEVTDDMTRDEIIAAVDEAQE